MMRRCRPWLGTFVEVECDTLPAIDAAFVAIAQVHQLMSAHAPDSELSQINCSGHRQSVSVSAPTAEVLRRAQRWAELSGGAFDVARAGGESLARGALALHPGQPALDPDVDWTAIKLEGDTVRLERAACLNLGGIAKGYAVDLAIAALRDAGAAKGLINAGGDLRGFGDRAYSIAIPDPQSRQPLVMTSVENAALATSAGLPDASERLDFGHLPRSARDWISVTVRAPNACDADALTKIVWALGHGAEELLRDHQAEAIVIDGARQIQRLGAAQVTA